MLKKLLATEGITLTKELSDAVIADINFNNVKFNKYTSLKDLLEISKRCDRAFKRCA